MVCPMTMCNNIIDFEQQLARKYVHSLFSIDSDIDECEVYNYNDYCNEYHEGFICNNLIGDYQCICGPGYYFSHYSYECIRKKLL